MKRFLIVVAAVSAQLILISTAGAWQIWTEGGAVLYRPGTGDARPEPGVAPLPLDINYDLRNAPAGVQALVGQSVATWDSVTGTSIDFNIIGAVECCPVGDNCWCDDGVNTIAYVKKKWPWGSGTLGVTYLQDWDDTTGAVYETDMELNGEDFKWAIDAVPTAGQYDLLSVIIHEMGHMLAFDDLYKREFTQSTMFGVMMPGDIRPRTLDLDDMDGLRFMYPLTAGDYPPPFITGISTVSDTVERDKIIRNQGTNTSGNRIFGYGFIEADGQNSIALQVWQNGSEVGSPEVEIQSFQAYNELRASIAFNGDVGEYDLVVINPDGQSNMAVDAIQVNLAGNVAPVANADNDSTVEPGDQVGVCVDAVDPIGDGDGDAPLQIAWELVAQPETSVATLSDPTADCVTFTADTVGYYYLEVSVFDGLVRSFDDGVLVTARPATKDGGGGDDSGGGSSGGCSCSVGQSGMSKKSVPADAILVLLAPFFMALLRRRYHGAR